MISRNSVCSVKNLRLASDSINVSEAPVWYGFTDEMADSCGCAASKAFLLLPSLLGPPSLLFLAALILFTRLFAVSSGRPHVLLISAGVHVAAISSKSSPRK